MGIKLLRHISLFGVGIYLLALVAVSVAFPGHAMQAKWIFWGVGEVLFFFVCTTFFYPRWKQDDPKKFLRKVFWVALAIRAVYAFLMCYYYYYETGLPFEYAAADSISYHKSSQQFMRLVRRGDFSTVFRILQKYTMGYSDQGYMLWLTLVYTIFGPNVLTPRLLKALMSAYLCVVVYKLAKRTISERSGRLAAVMCVFMPMLIQSCGLHTKETDMIFISILALERMDYLIRSKKYTFWNILLPILLTGLTFGYRTIIGMSLLIAFVVFVLLSPNDLVGKKGKIVSIGVTFVVFLAFLYTKVGVEMRYVYRQRFYDWNFQKERYGELGMKHNEMAHTTYLAPGAFVLPLAPLTEEANSHNKMINGAIYVKNFIGFFSMLAIVFAFRQKRWRDFSLIGTYVLSYLGIIMCSFAANSERYHEPTFPLLILMAAYAMTRLRRIDMKLFYAYCGVLLVALIAWNWLKLSARGLV